MDTKYVVGILVIVVLAIGAYFLLTRAPQVPVDGPGMMNENDPVPGDMDGDGVDFSLDVVLGETTVTYTDTGFSPASVTVKKGQSVTFVNAGTGRMWVGADEHPSHTQYSGTARQEHCPDTTGTAFDQCGVSERYTFTFAKTGTWGYHNHVGASHSGTVIVID